MIRITARILVVVLVVLAAASIPSRAQLGWAERPAQQPDPKAPLFLPGEVLVGFKAGVTPAEVAASHAAVQAAVLRVNQRLAIHRVRTPLPVDEAIRRYQADPRVAHVQPNYLGHPVLVPNDPFYDNFNANPDDLQRWYLGPANVDAENAWDTTAGRNDVVIAIVDSGIDLDHPELAPLIWTNPGEIPANAIDDDGNGFVDDVNGWDFYTGPAYCCGNTRDADPNPDLGDGLDNDGDGDPDDNTSHGTFVAGTACAATNNSAEGAGAAWLCRLMALKVFTDDGSTPFSDVIDAITYAADNGADVINLSLGSDAEVNLFCPTTNPLMEAAITYARNQGALVVAAAGNDNSSGSVTPASCTHAMTVGASDSASVTFGGSGDTHGRASFSNFGASDVVAPGVHIVSPWVCSTDDVNTGFANCTVAGGQPGAGWVVASNGTSFAAPLVAGQASLLISNSFDNSISSTPDDVRACIQSTAQDLPDDPGDVPDAGPAWDGNGRVDFSASLADADLDGLADCLATTAGPIARVVASEPTPATGSQITACTFIDMTPTPELLGSYGAELTWDPAVLQYVGFTPGFGAPVVNTTNVATGLLSFAGADAAGAGGDVFLLCVDFAVGGVAGTGTPLDLSLTSLFAAATFTDLLPMATVNDDLVSVVSSCIVGELNGDGVINSGDALLILSYLVALPIPASVTDAILAGCGDTDGMTGTTAADANVVLSWEVGLPIDPAYPIGMPNQTLDVCPTCASGGVGEASAATSQSPATSAGKLHARLASSLRVPRRGQEFVLSVALETAGAGLRVGSYNARLRWNPLAVEFLGAEGGRSEGFGAPVINPAATSAGELRFAAANPWGAAGTVELLRVRFRALRSLGHGLRPFELDLVSVGAPAPGFENLLPLLERERPRGKPRDARRR